MAKREKPLRNASLQELQAYVGKLVVKVSGKPFSNRSKVAKVTGVIEHPYTGRWAFTFTDAEYVAAEQCKLGQFGTLTFIGEPFTIKPGATESEIRTLLRGNK